MKELAQSDTDSNGGGRILAVFKPNNMAPENG